MKRIRKGIPTIIQNGVEKKENTSTRKGKRKKPDLPPSVVIFQHNNLVEARYTLTLQEKRLILWLISRITPEEENFKKHELTVKEFMSLMDLKGNANYKELQKITYGLMKKILVIKKPDEQTLTQVNWINYAHYEEKLGKIQVAFSDAMKPFLLHLKTKFTAIEVTDLMQFTSIHAIRIYELLKQYEHIGERVLSLEEIRRCCGIEKKLKQYVEFERYVLLIAQREMQEKSDLYFEFEKIKESRKIVAIKFFIRKNKDIDIKKNPEKYNQEVKRKPPVIDALRDFGLTNRTINQILRENTEQQIQDAINAVDIQLSKGGVRNTKAMMITAIKELWHPERFKAK